MCKKSIFLIACALLLSAACGIQAAVLEITPTAPVSGDLDIANFVGAAVDLDNVGTVTDPADFYTNDATTYVAHDRGGQGQTFLTGDNEAGYLITGVWVQHVGYTEPCITWYRMQVDSQLDIRITDPTASGTDAFVLSSESYVVTGEEENRLPEETLNDPLGTGLWIHVTLDEPVALAANTEYGFDLTSISGLGPVLFFETLGIKDDAAGGNPYPDGSAYVTGSAGAADNVMTPAPGDRVFVVELELAQAAEPEPAAAFSDDFETPHDYLTEGLGAYDGILNGTIEVLDASISRAGLLYMQTADAVWDPGPGPLLYVNVTGDFVATVKVTDFTGETGAIVENNDSGIVARDPADDGAEDWVSVNYFPTWTAFNVRSTDDGVRSEHGQPAGSWEGVDTFALAEQYPYIQLERVGSDFYPRISADGVNFIPLTEETYQGIYDGTQTPLVISRPDLPDTLQVGLMNCTYTANSGYAVFDDFSIDFPTKPVAPVHSYTFEDGTANDSVGEAHGTLVGEAAVVGGALVTYDQDDWMEMPGDIIAMNTFEEVTVEAWYTPTAGANTSWSMLAYFGDSVNGLGSNGFFITSARNDDKSRAAISIGDIATPWASETGADGPEYDDGLLHHMVSTINATDITLYIDGELIASTPLDPHNSISGISQNFAYLAKGGYDGDPEWIGSVEEFNIYNKALSPGQVAANYAAGPVKGPVHSYTFEDGTANDSIGSAHGTLVGDAAVVGGQLVLDGDGDWMDMPGDVIAMNTFEELTIEIMFTSVAGANTGFAMVTAFGESGTGEGPNFGYRYICITPARGDNVSRAMIQTSSMDNDPWNDETGVSDVIEHDDGLPHHMVCTVDNKELAFYIDGVLIGTAALAPGNEIAGIGTDVASIGKAVYPQDPLWIGSVEELNIYDYALSPDQVAAKYAAGPQKAGLAPVDPGTDGLMLHLPLDTASRGTTQDSSDNDLDGKVVGDPAFVEGVDIMAMEFDGVDDRVEIADNPAFDAMSEKFTITAWIKLSAEGTTDRRPIMSKELEPDPDGRGWEFKVNEGQLAMQLYSPVEGEGKLTITGTTALDADQWYHVVGIYQADGLEQFYINGKLDHEQELVTALQSNDSPANIGAYIWSPTGYQKYFAGLIDDVRIYNRALSTQEILFLAGK